MRYVVAFGLTLSVLLFLFMLGWAGSVSAVLTPPSEPSAKPNFYALWALVILPWLVAGALLIFRRRCRH